jgi:hypothetical protein
MTAMRTMRLIAALALFAGLAGCAYGPAEFYPVAAEMHPPPPVTLCGDCESHAAVLPPTPDYY